MMRIFLEDIWYYILKFITIKEKTAFVHVTVHPIHIWTLGPRASRALMAMVPPVLYCEAITQPRVDHAFWC